MKQSTGIWKGKETRKRELLVTGNCLSQQDNSPTHGQGHAVTLLMLKCSITSFAHISLLLSFVCFASKL